MGLAGHTVAAPGHRLRTIERERDIKQETERAFAKLDAELLGFIQRSTETIAQNKH